MKLQSFCTALGLTALTLSLSIFPGFSQDNSSNRTRFFCNQMFDQASGEKIPTTLAWSPERQAHLLFIAWKSEAFSRSQWTPLRRCQVVSEKFQKFNESGFLNYLTVGKVMNLPVICAVKNTEETCNSNNQLFTLKNGTDPKLVLEQLVNISQGKVGRPIYQSSGGKIYLNVSNYLENAPVVNVKE
ncbi:hypothetical protein H6F32_19855 [Anabaena sp. FACHB-1237]|uniref:COP23 domain-containing protein n=1 Tax=Anabaena sp. FACHB-1237 TaxID=2692769 RepID=UPI0016802AA9|nr:COP23 domain-containing protein [Anabaena sp. FACHB-1237]MBD2139748.1 hypothetical protein [Anabaena sp. FACHB-1237]